LGRVGDQPVAGREQVGLGVAVVPGGSARTERRNAIVGTRHRALREEGPHGDGGRGVAGGGDPGV